MYYYPALDFSNINNTNAVAFLRGLRKQYSGLAKCYGTRYLDALAKVCDYQVTNYGKALILGPRNASNKEFKSNKETGRFMESKINDLFDLGILK